jgi:flagellar biosynthesis/type III secretory pathway protein FliH
MTKGYSQEVPLLGEEEERFLEDLEEEIGQYAENLYENSQKKAQNLIEDAKKEAEEILQEAKDKAKEAEKNLQKKLEEQTEIAEKEIEMRLSEAQHEVDVLIEEGKLQKQLAVQEAEPQIVEVIKHVVTQIIHEEVTHHTRWVELLVKRAVEEEKIEGTFKVKVSPTLYSQISQEKILTEQPHRVQLVADENLSDTTCVVETKEGTMLYDPLKSLEDVLSEIQTLLKI